MGNFSIVLLSFCIWALNLNSNSLIAQSIFESVTIRESELVVHIECTIRAGNTCNGLRIMRSRDGINFNQIGVVTGICGDERISVKYNISDENPYLNAFNYYQIEPGGFDVSETVSIFVSDLKENNLLLFPNPALEYINILILPELVPNHTIQISDMNGLTFIRSEIMNSISELDISHLFPGIYVVQVYDFEQRIVAKSRFTKI